VNCSDHPTPIAAGASNLLDGLDEVVPQVPAVCDLHRVRAAGRGCPRRRRWPGCRTRFAHWAARAATPREVLLPDGQRPVGEFGADGQHEACGEAVRPRTPRRDLTTSMPAASIASNEAVYCMVEAWARRNRRHHDVSVDRSGAGGTRRSVRILRMVDAPSGWPSLRSSPWMALVARGLVLARPAVGSARRSLGRGVGDRSGSGRPLFG
jgi:hypothetical protein